MTLLPPTAQGPAAVVEWYQDLWNDVSALQVRYKLPIRTNWWEKPLHVEALAALCAWVNQADNSKDFRSKLELLHNLDRIGSLIRDGNDPFRPETHQHAFDDFCATLLASQPQSAATGADRPLDRGYDIPDVVAAMNPDEIRREAERIVGEDSVSTDVLRDIVADYYRSIL